MLRPRPTVVVALLILLSVGACTGRAEDGLFGVREVARCLQARDATVQAIGPTLRVFGPTPRGPGSAKRRATGMLWFFEAPSAARRKTQRLRTTFSENTSWTIRNVSLFDAGGDGFASLVTACLSDRQLVAPDRVMDGVSPAQPLQFGAKATLLTSATPRQGWRSIASRSGRGKLAWRTTHTWRQRRQIALAVSATKVTHVAVVASVGCRLQSGGGRRSPVRYEGSTPATLLLVTLGCSPRVAPSIDVDIESSDSDVVTARVLMR